MRNSKNEHIVELSKLIIDSIESPKVDSESILLKCKRLASYLCDDETSDWLQYELRGYKDDLSNLTKFIDNTNRWIDIEKNKFISLSLKEIETDIEENKAKIKSIRISDPNTDLGAIAVNTILKEINLTVKQYLVVKDRVIYLLHEFATKIYYEHVIEELATSIFENYKRNVDGLITESSKDIIEKIPYVISRLKVKDPESISQALNTCRRIIDKFADSIFPAQKDQIKIGDNMLSLKQDKVLNRINAFIHLNCESPSRKKRLRQNLANLYDRVCSGIHSDVGYNEALNLFLNVYLIVGEVLAMKK